MERKKSNLAVSVDLTKSADFLVVLDAVGPYVCLIKACSHLHRQKFVPVLMVTVTKTHIDILEDFTPEVIEKMQELSTKHDFVIFEDRKFADIGTDSSNPS